LIPYQLANSLASRQLMACSRMRNCFDRSEEINKKESSRLIEEMKLLYNEAEHEYNTEETTLIEDGKEELQKSEKYHDIALLNGMSNLASLATDSDGKWMMVTTDVRASAEQVLAHLWHFEGRGMMTAMDAKREVVVNHSRHRQSVKLISMSSERSRVELLNTMVWKKNINGSYLIVSSPTKKEVDEGNDSTHNRKSSRRPSALLVLPAWGGVLLAKKGELRSYFHIEAISANKCQLKHGFCFDLGLDSKSRKLAKKMMREHEYLLPLATKVQEHFQSLRCNIIDRSRCRSSSTGIGSIGRDTNIALDDADGIAMGEALMMTMKRLRAGGKKKKKNIVAAAVKQFINEYKAMSELLKNFNWMDIVLVEILNKVTKKIEKIESKLDCLEKEEARLIGAALVTIVAKSINEHAGVNDWIEKYPSMKELCIRHKFIAPMMEVIATQTSREVNWKMLVRAASKAFISFFDLITDLYMIYFYFSNDQASFGKSRLSLLFSTCCIYSSSLTLLFFSLLLLLILLVVLAFATIAMILMSLIMQTSVIFFLYQGDKKAMKRELFYVLSLVKGSRLQLQVLKGEDTQGCSIEVASEMATFEVQEMMWER
jgi:hypothetical protein